MTAANPSRLGQIDGAGDALALFLKVFAGEVLTAFDRETAFKQRHTVRTIPHGKSAQFPVTGLASAYYHVPGTELLGEQIRHGERIINVEDVLVAPVFVANFDELLNHYDVRSIYSNEIGEALARRYDQDVSRVIINAARAPSNIPGDPGLSGGGSDNDVDYDTDGEKLWKGIFNAGVVMDQKDIPKGPRYAGLRPVQYALVVQSGDPINRDFNEPNNGSIADGVVNRVNDIALFKTNNLAQSDDRSNASLPANRRNDYSVTRAIIFHPAAAGTVQLQDVAMEQAYDVRRQGTLMVGKYLVGHDYLRPEGAYELRTGDPAA